MSDTLNAKIIIIVSGFSPFVLHAVDINANASAGLTYSNNIDLEATNKDSALVGTVSASTSIMFKQKKSDLLLKYNAFRTKHFSSSNKDKSFNTLALTANHKAYEDRISLNANAAISNVSNSIRGTNNADIINGNTIETRRADTRVNFKNKSNKYVDLSATLNAGLVSSEDNIGNRSNLGTTIVLQNGDILSNYSWVTTYFYKRTFYNGSNLEPVNYNFEQRFGFEPIDKFTAFLSYRYEEVIQDDIRIANDYFAWGPSVRYAFDEKSYIELRYEVPSEDDNFWSGALLLNPTARTRLNFDYTKRIFGDSYLFSLSHKAKRITNSIQYDEEITDFDRETFVEGEVINSYQLAKKLSYTSNLALKKSSLDFTITALERTPLIIDEFIKLERVSTNFAFNYQLTKRASFSQRFGFDKDMFTYRSLDDEINYYRTHQLSLSNQFSKNLTGDFSYTYANTSNYTENKISMNFQLTL